MLARHSPCFSLTLASRELGRFTAKVGGTVDAASAFNTYMARDFEELSQDAVHGEKMQGAS